MPSVVGLLERHELGARRRVDGLREEADRIQAELAAAEQEWQKWAIARRRVDTVLASVGRSTADAEVVPDPRDADVPSGAPGFSEAEVAGAYVACGPFLAGAVGGLPAHPARRRGPCPARSRAAGPLACQEMAVLFGMDVVPARVEALRSKAKRLVARGWLAEPAPGRFTLAAGVSGPGGGS